MMPPPSLPRHFGHSASIAGALLAATAAAAGTPCPPLPEPRQIRYEERYPPQPDGCPTSLAGRLKSIPIGAARLDIGGEWRVRLEATDVPDFGTAGARDRAVLSRLLLHANLRASDDIRLFMQAGSFLGSRRLGTGPTDVSRLDLAQGFVELNQHRGATTATLRLGRQEMAFGSSRLVSIRESPNIRRAFDGARLGIAHGRLRLDGVWLRPVRLHPGVFDDASDGNEQLYGVYGSFGSGNGAGLDLYWLGLERRSARFAAGTGREVRHSLGARLFGQAGPLDWDIEPVLQTGRFASGHIRAWTLASNLGYRLSALPGRPRLGLKADIASGDRDPDDRVLQSFNPLYPRLPYFTEAGLAVPSNIMDLHPSLTLDIATGGRLTLGANLLWRHRREDAVYVPPFLPGLPAVLGSRFIGTQWEAGTEWRLARGVEFKFYLVRLSASTSLTSLGARSGSFGATSIGFRF